MATSYVSGNIRTIITSNWQNALDLSSVADNLALTLQDTYANGTGANQVQAQFHDQRTLATTTGETLDLRALTCAFGTLTFAKVKTIIIKLTTATTGYRLEVGDDQATANKWTAPFKAATDTVRVEAGGIWHAGSPVDGMTVDATHKYLYIYNPSGGNAVYDIIIIGTGTVA